jgi:hypothetical protein
MEETIWVYFGVISAIIALGIVVSLVMTQSNETAKQSSFAGMERLGEQADLVCDAPKNTMLSLSIVFPAEAIMTTDTNRLCLDVDGKTRCIATKCDLSARTVLNLSGTSDLFSSHKYTCTVLHADTMEISCAG